MAHHRNGRLEAAERLYRRVLAQAPRHADSLHLLGVVALTAGRSEVAVEWISQAIAIDGAVAAFHTNLGTALQNLGRTEEAVACHRRATRLIPTNHLCHYNLGNALAELGRYQEAADCHRKAVEIRPDHLKSHNNLGNALKALGRLDEAVACYRHILTLDPNTPEAHVNLGNALYRLGRLEESVACYRQALALAPAAVDAHNNLGNVLQELGRPGDAMACYRQALAIRPDHAEAHNNLGNVLHGMGLRDDALASYRKAIDLKPDYAEAHQNLGNLHQEAGRLADAVACYRRALEIRPTYAEALGQLVHLRHKLCDWNGLADEDKRVVELVRRGEGTVSPFLILGLDSSPADQLSAARAFGAKFGGAASPAPAPRDQDRIRIGYLSADYHDHATAHLIAELIETHDRERFEIVAYSYGPDDRGPVRRRLVVGFDRFVDLSALAVREAAERIRGDGIHVLVDLKGYTQDSRTGILALRPAPVQVNFLGYPGTMGADFIDYIVADPVCIPPDHDRFYSEKVVRLPDCYQPNDTRRPISAKVPTRAECGLPAQGFVFCSFNNSYKVTEPFFSVWMRLLGAVPGSVLWLLESNPWVGPNLHREAVRRGIDPGRVVLAPHRPLADHLARYRLADLFLDSLPYNAHTTASDALWAGLPVLTCAGRTFAGRVAASLLIAAGLPELITHDPAEYEALAVRLASDPGALAPLRDRLQATRDRVPLFDIRRYTDAIETAYTRMWDLHRAGKPAEAITIQAT